MPRVSLPKLDADRDPIDVSVVLAGVATLVVLLCIVLFGFMLLA